MFNLLTLPPHVRISLNEFKPSNPGDPNETCYCVVKLSEDLGFRPVIVKANGRRLVFHLKKVDTAHISFHILSYGFGQLNLLERPTSVQMTIRNRRDVEVGVLLLELAYFNVTSAVSKDEV
jgi:hypothetical protein